MRRRISICLVLRRLAYFMVIMGLTSTGLFSACSKKEKPVLVSAPMHSPRPAAPTPPSLKEFRFHLPAQPRTLDWNLAHTSVETFVLMNIMEGLVEFDEQLKVVPALTDRWEMSANRLTYRFFIRKGVLWTDGQELKSRHFLESWKRLTSPITASSYAYLLFDVLNAEEFHRGKIRDFSKVAIRAPSDYVLEVDLKRPVEHWLSKLTFWATFPIRKDVIDQHGKKWTQPGKLETLGPYRLFAIDSGTQLILKANPKYYRHRGNIDQVTARFVPSQKDAASLYREGKIDFLRGVSFTALKQVAPSSEIQTFEYLKTGYLGMNVNIYPFDDPSFRQAIGQALNKDKISGLLDGGQKAASTFVPPQLSSYSSQIGLRFNPVSARKSLRQSKWFRRQGANLNLIVRNDDSAIALGQWVQQQLLEHLKLNIDLRTYDYQEFRTQLKLGSNHMFLLHWGADYPDPDNFLSVFTSNSGTNQTGFKNSKYDELILNARTSPVGRQKNSLYQSAERILLEQQSVIVPLYYEPNLAAVKPWVRGLSINPLNYLMIRKTEVIR